MTPTVASGTEPGRQKYQPLKAHSAVSGESGTGYTVWLSAN